MSSSRAATPAVIETAPAFLHRRDRERRDLLWMRADDHLPLPVAQRAAPHRDARARRHRAAATTGAPWATGIQSVGASARSASLSRRVAVRRRRRRTGGRGCSDAPAHLGAHFDELAVEWRRVAATSPAGTPEPSPSASTTSTSRASRLRTPRRILAVDTSSSNSCSTAAACVSSRRARTSTVSSPDEAGAAEADPRVQEAPADARVEAHARARPRRRRRRPPRRRSRSR